jgi:cytochrome P450
MQKLTMYALIVDMEKQQLDEQIVVRLTAKERKELQKEADADSRKLSDYVRKIIRERHAKKNSK